MRRNALNFLIFVAVAVGFYVLWRHAEQKNWLPNPAAERAKKLAEEAKQREEDEQKARADAEARRKADETRRAATLAGAVATAAATNPAGAAVAAARFDPAAVATIKPPEPPKKDEPPKVTAPPREPATLIALGGENSYIRVLLTTRGGGVQQVILQKFEDADRLARPMPGVPLFLIPGIPQVRGRYLSEPFPTPDLKPGVQAPDAVLSDPSFTVFLYPTPDDQRPDTQLGEMNWKVVAEERPADGPQSVVFEAELGAPYFVKFRKTYTLAPKDYHVGLKLDIQPLPGREKGKGKIRYQLSGPRGVPIEGEWFTAVYRAAVIGWKDRKETPRRQYEDAASIAIKRGGDVVTRSDNTFQYMVVANQFFASGVAIDNTAEGAARNPWAYVRATTELPFDTNAHPDTAYFDDVTVRAASEVIDLAPGETVTHSYLLYNGPAKVRLLGLMRGDMAVDPGLVARYQDDLGLRTITDFRSDNWFGRFANAIWWTDLVIAVTNIMHEGMAAIHRVVPSWAMCIVVLTVMVRLLLFYPSKRQTQMNLKLMEVQKRLAPQIEELKRKHGEDYQAFNQAKMKLMMQNGVNPFAAMGGCLLLLAQLPIMMGLYFCLQESVFFRLEPFLWIKNLAAPDMTVWWGEHIPFLSTPQNMGNFWYLGPYFNVLPLVAVGLMIWQQNKMMPPPTDEHMAQQQKMMKYMMIAMAIMFYKVAAGLALYFIIGAAWGLIERQFIPKPGDKKPGDPKADANGTTTVGTSAGPVAVPKPKGMLGRLREAAQKKMEEMQKKADEMSQRKIRNEPNPGPKPPPGQHPPRRDDRRDKKKKRRK